MIHDRIKDHRRARAGDLAGVPPAKPVPRDRWGVFVDCQSEERQRELLERLTQEGYDCRGLTS
jgi:hypothetical protein